MSVFAGDIPFSVVYCEVATFGVQRLPPLFKTADAHRHNFQARKRYGSHFEKRRQAPHSKGVDIAVRAGYQRGNPPRDVPLMPTPLPAKAAEVRQHPVSGALGGDGPLARGPLGPFGPRRADHCPRAGPRSGAGRNGGRWPPCDLSRANPFQAPAGLRRSPPHGPGSAARTATRSARRRSGWRGPGPPRGPSVFGPCRWATATPPRPSTADASTCSITTSTVRPIRSAASRWTTAARSGETATGWSSPTTTACRGPFPPWRAIASLRWGRSASLPAGTPPPARPAG